MKPAYCTLAAAALLSATVSLAQQAAPGFPAPNRVRVPAVEPATEALPANYQIALSVTDKDGGTTEVSTVVASSRFSVSLGEPSLTFVGTLAVAEGGEITMNYTLGWETLIAAPNTPSQFRSSSVQGTVRLKEGEELIILRAGPRTAKVSVAKLPASKAK